MYTIPAGQEESMKSRIAKVTGTIKKEGDYDQLVIDEESKTVVPPSVMDLTAEAPLKFTPKSEEDLVEMNLWVSRRPWMPTLLLPLHSSTLEPY